MPDCGCNKKSCSAPAVLEITNKEAPVVFHKVIMPAAMGDDETNPPRNGQYCNVLLEYEANGHIWMFSSDGIPTFISNGRDQGTINYEELLNKPLINDVELIGNVSLEDLGITDLIDDEADAREEADIELQNAIDAEATTRSHADILLQDAIDAEIAAREAAVSAEESARIIADNDIISRIPVVNDATLTIQKNGSTVATFTANDADNVTADIAVPTKTSDITNDSGFITNTVNNLTNYYTKTESDTALTNEATIRADADTNLQEQIDAISSASDVVDVVGTYAELQAYDTSRLHDNDIIKVLTDETHDDAISYYRWDDANDTFVYIGSQGPFYTKSETDATFVPQTRTVNNKALSSNIALTAADVGALPDSTVIPTVNDATLTIQKNGTTVQTFTANQATNATANIAVPTKTSDLTNDSDFPVDANYVHTDNNYTTADKNKLAGIAAGAEVNVQSDWNESDNSSDAYIQNKPSIPDSTSDLVNDSGFITNSVNNLTNYYKKSETYNKTEVDGLIPTKTSDLTNDGADGTSTYVEADDLATVATSGSYNDLTNKPTIPAAQVNSDWNASSGVAQILNKPTLATVATSGSYNDLTDKPTIDTGLVEMSYGESDAWAKFIAAYQANKIVYCRASSNANPATGTQGRKAFMAYVNNADNPTEVEFQYVRSVSSKTASQPVDQVFVYKLTSANGGTWTVQTRDMAPKLAQGTNTTVSYSNGTYTISATQPTVPTKTSDLTNDGSDGTSTYVEADDLATVATTGSYNDLVDKPSIPSSQVQSDWAQTDSSEVDFIKNKPTLATVATSGSYNDLSNKPTIGNATLTIQKNGASAGTFTANATSNKTINITVPTTAADVSALPASTKYGASIAVSINTTDYKVTTTLKDQDGNTLGTAQVIDLPLESVVVSGSYDSTNKKIVLTLQNGNTIDIPVADLVAGLQSEITSTNMLDADLVDDSTSTHKFVTAAQITKLNGIAAGAEVNQNAFSNVKVGSTTVAADAKTDTLEFVAGSNITLTPDATNDKVTIAATDTTYSDATTSTHGLMSAADKTKLNGIATGAEVNVQSDWTQTTTTADDYIKNKPTLATVATSGSYNDLSNKPTIPTVNNATLTIQKNSTNVATFTANASSNVTANISVPTATSDLTNDSGFVTSSGTVAKANQLTTARTIAISGGATGTATSFNGTSNISIPITDIKSAYVTWGGKDIVGNISPDDAGCIDEFGHNKLAFLPAECIEAEYSTDGGSTWTDYGLTDAQKVALVTTTGPGVGAGKNATITAANIANMRGRIRIACGTLAKSLKIYTALKKILINFSTNGATGTKVKMRYRTIANYLSDTDTWVDLGTHDINGWSGWNSYPYTAGNFGGNMTSQTGQPGQIEFEFWGTGYSSSYASRCAISDIRFIGVTNWGTPSELARAGHLYTMDTSQNATFPANVKVTGSLQHGNYTYTLPNKNGTVAMTSDLPTVNNATLTIQKNGANVQTFTANQSTNATANITVPTKTSDLTNDSNFVASTSLATVATSGSYNDLSNKPTIPTVNNATLTIQKNGTNVQTFTANQSTNATANITVPTKISDLSNTSGGFITYCTCSTAAATAAKVVALDSGDSNWVLRKGAIIGVKFTNTNTASSVTLNVNSSGAKSIYYNNAAYTGSSNSICGYANRYTFYMYDGTYWVWISDGRHDGNDNTYTTAYCSTAAGTAAKAASMTGYTLTANRYTVITFTNANSAASALTLNINGRGAKPLYINGTASSASNHTLAAGSYIVYYDGTNYYINNNGEIPRMIHSESPVSTSSVTPIVTNSMISDGTITFSKTATGEFLKLTLTTTDPGAGSALAANTLLGVYE